MNMPRRSTPFAHRPALLIAGLLALAVAAAVALSFIFASGLFGSGGDQNTPYVEAVVGSPQRINPLFAYLNDTDRDLVSLVFSGLTRLAADGQVLPDLAESWSYSSDGRTVTFQLRHNVKWHTGVPFTSADVLFTFNLLADPNLKSDPDQAALWQTVHCTAPDDFTVACTLSQPFAPFLAYATIGIVPRHLLEGTGAAALMEDAFNRAPVGTGPYRLTHIDDTNTLLTAYADYHLGAPGVRQIDLRFFPDMGTAAAAIVSGNADGLLVDTSAKAYSESRSAYTMLYLNNSEPPLIDAKVRRAVSLAVDADAIISNLLAGRGLRGDTPIPPGTWAFNPDHQPPGRDVGRARQLLDEAGWVLPDGADIRQRNGTELRISIMTDRDALRGAVADVIARQLAEAGIAATVVREDSTALVRDFLLPRRYEAAVFGWEPGPDPDPYSAWHSSQATGDGRNLAGYSDPAADSVIEDARRSNNLDQRQSLYYTFQQLFEDAAPSVLLYYPVLTYFVSDEVKNVRSGVMFDTSSRFRNVYEWTFEEAPDIRGR
jgi:peptide/nickel transport system substrate-binding protein